MAFGISINARGEDAQLLRNFWNLFSRFEHSPSMAQLNYPPHLTLAAYDTIDELQLRRTLEAAFSGQSTFQLRFERIGIFTEPQLVFWADPAPSIALQRAHMAIHELIDPALCREHYRPGIWVPHSTIALQVRAENREQATALAACEFAPFDVVFDTVCCAEFLPVRVIEEYRLSK